MSDCHCAMSGPGVVRVSAVGPEYGVRPYSRQCEGRGSWIPSVRVFLFPGGVVRLSVKRAQGAVCRCAASVPSAASLSTHTALVSSPSLAVLHLPTYLPTYPPTYLFSPHLGRKPECERCTLSGVIVDRVAAAPPADQRLARNHPREGGAPTVRAGKER